MGSELTLGTFCHENGHMLCDYPDLYDYGNESSGIGAFCLMCGGGNINPKNPVPIGAYLKRLAGWSGSVTALTHGGQVSLAADTNDFAIHARSGREYFLIENRRRNGRDAALPGEGLAIWHIDEDGNNSFEHMSAGSHYECSLEQADGLFQLERGRGLYGDPADLFAGPAARFADNTRPDSKWWSGSPSQLTIDQISAAGPSVTFRSLFGDAEVVVPSLTLRRDSQPNRPIPDNNATGITDTITFTENQTISSVRIGLDIAHPYRGDMRVTLTTPLNTVFELHPKNLGGSADDLKVTYDETKLPALSTLRGKNTQGGWRLTVQDLAAADVGRLNSWWLEFGVAAASTQPVRLEESPGAAIPDNTSAGIERSLTTAETGQVGSVEISIDISHTYIADLRVRLRAPSGAEAILHDRTGGSADNIARVYTATDTPSLAALAGQPIAGAWKLLVSDHDAVDTGKLNKWTLTLRRGTAAVSGAGG
jgi:subtilisin-like proprotein convertase family protein